MSMYIIGRIFDEGGMVLAFKIYDANSKKIGIYEKGAVYEQVKRGVLVVGLYKGSDGMVSGIHGSFNVSKTDKLNGAGRPIEETGRYILIAISGYLENSQYKLVNSRGYEKTIGLEEFKSMVEADKINGAIKSERTTSGLVLYKHCNHRQYWIKEENNLE